MRSLITVVILSHTAELGGAEFGALVRLLDSVPPRA